MKLDVLYNLNFLAQSSTEGELEKDPSASAVLFFMCAIIILVVLIYGVFILICLL